jgi:hypothetical protein
MASRPLGVFVTRPASARTPRWWAVVEAESPIVLAAALNEHPCSPSNRSTAKRVGEAMARATTRSFSISNLSIPIETSARFRRDYARMGDVPLQFHVLAVATPDVCAPLILGGHAGHPSGVAGACEECRREHPPHANGLFSAVAGDAVDAGDTPPSFARWEFRKMRESPAVTPAPHTWGTRARIVFPKGRADGHPPHAPHPPHEPFSRGKRAGDTRRNGRSIHCHPSPACPAEGRGRDDPLTKKRPTHCPCVGLCGHFWLAYLQYTPRPRGSLDVAHKKTCTSASGD